MNPTSTRDDADLLERLSAYRSTLDDAITHDLETRTANAAPVRARRRLPLVAAAVIAVVGVGGLVANNLRTVPTSLSGDTDDATIETAASDVETTTPPTTAPRIPALDGSLSVGANAPQVRVLEERLVALGFVPGPVDAVFDERTESAVWAFEKAVVGVAAGDVTGAVDADVWAALHGDVEIAPKADSGLGSHIEVWLPEQVLVVFSGGDAVVVSHISSGQGTEWCDTVTVDPGEYGNERGDQAITDLRCGVSDTPGGVFEVRRSIEGTRQTAAGRLVDPLYFNYWVAIAGSDDVPVVPASRGHVTVPVHAIEQIRVFAGVGTPVWVFDGDTDPRQLGEQLPIFDWPAPLPNPTASPTGIYAIGDSVLLGAAAPLHQLGIAVDAEASRQIHDAVPIAQATAEARPTAVVVHLGTNGPISPTTLEHLLDELEDVPDVIVLTVRIDRAWTNANNELLRKTSERDNVIVIDWERLAEQCPGECFATDNIHLQLDGSNYYAQLIADTLGLG
jgi:hypothetical protein